MSVYQTIRFQEVTRKATKRVKCTGCGKVMTRSQSFTQTVNPFNQNPDGTVKTYSEVHASLAPEVEAWEAQVDGQYHWKCDPENPDVALTDDEVAGLPEDVREARRRAIAQVKWDREWEAQQKSSNRRHRILEEIKRERARQVAKHGDQTDLPLGFGRMEAVDELYMAGYEANLGARMDDSRPIVRQFADTLTARTNAASRNEGGDGSITFEHILTEEYAEVLAETDPARVRAELVQLAAVCVQIVEAIDQAAEGGDR